MLPALTFTAVAPASESCVALRPAGVCQPAPVRVTLPLRPVRADGPFRGRCAAVPDAGSVAVAALCTRLLWVCMCVTGAALGHNHALACACHPHYACASPARKLLLLEGDQGAAKANPFGGVWLCESSAYVSGVRQHSCARHPDLVGAIACAEGRLCPQPRYRGGLRSENQEEAGGQCSAQRGCSWPCPARQAAAAAAAATTAGGGRSRRYGHRQ